MYLQLLQDQRLPFCSECNSCYYPKTLKCIIAITFVYSSAGVFSYYACVKYFLSESGFSKEHRNKQRFVILSLNVVYDFASISLAVEIKDYIYVDME